MCCTGGKDGIWFKADTLGNLLIVNMTPSHPVPYSIKLNAPHIYFVLFDDFIHWLCTFCASASHICNCKHEGKGRKRLSLKSKGRENLLRSNSCLDTHKSLYEHCC